MFSDLQSIITSNGLEAFKAIVTRRIDDHKASEAAKLEAQRLAMQAEADRKAKADADAVLAKERAEMEAKVQAEAKAEASRVAAANKAQMESQMQAQAKIRAEQEAVEKQARDAEAVRVEEARQRQQIADSAARQGKVTAPIRPTDGMIINVIALRFCVSDEVAARWIRDIANNLRSE